MQTLLLWMLAYKCLEMMVRGMGFLIFSLFYHWRITFPILIGLWLIGYFFPSPPAPASVAPVPAAGQIELLSSELDFGDYLVQEGRNGGIPTIKLKLRSTYDFAVEVTHAICSLRGPLAYNELHGSVEYDSDHPSWQHDLGGRRLFVTYEVIDGTPGATDLAADHGSLVRPGETHTVAMRAISPALILGNETVEWCVTGHSEAGVEGKADLGDINRFQWISTTPYGDAWLATHSFTGR